MLMSYIMSKRHADEAFETIAGQNSPASKKTRVEDEYELPARSYGIQPARHTTNGHEAGSDAHTVVGIPVAADQQEEDSVGPGSPDDSENIQDSVYKSSKRQNAPLDGYTDLYLDTIDRSVLDFDFEKLCCVTLSNINVYACLVCGKYYQGRGPKSHAYFHALEVGHHVYVNMQTKRVYVLPEGYEVKSKSLEDIKFVVDPRLSREEVTRLDKEVHDSRDLSGKIYRPGMR